MYDLLYSSDPVLHGIALHCISYLVFLYVDINPSVLLHCWLGDRKCIRPIASFPKSLLLRTGLTLSCSTKWTGYTKSVCVGGGVVSCKNANMYACYIGRWNLVNKDLRNTWWNIDLLLEWITNAIATETTRKGARDSVWALDELSLSGNCVFQWAYVVLLCFT